MNDPGSLKARAKALGLHGLVSHWTDSGLESWVAQLIAWEEAGRAQRSLLRRVAAARIGRFKPLCDFDWGFPKRCDRGAIEELMTLEFLKEATNVVLIGPNGVGKTMIARNIAHQALVHGYTVRFVSASEMLAELSALDSDSALRRRLRHYSAPALLCLDEVGYLSYGNRHADLLFELINRRYEAKSILLTTNKSFSSWPEVFPNASCVVSMVDRITHHAEIIPIDGESYRIKEAREAAKEKALRRKAKKPS